MVFYMDLYGLIWFDMVLYGFVWFYMVLYGFIWVYMGLCVKESRRHQHHEDKKISIECWEPGAAFFASGSQAARVPASGCVSASG